MQGENNSPDRSLMMRLGFSVFLSMNVMVLTMFLWSRPDTFRTTSAAVGLDSGDSSATPADVMYDLARYGCSILSTVVIWILCEPLLADAWSAIRLRRLSMSVLLLTGVLAAYVYSLISVLGHGGPVYFEVTCMVLVITTLGRWFEATGRQRTTRALRELEGFLPASARRWIDGKESAVSAAELQIGDTIRVLPGERIPVDGRLMRNSASLDMQAITGESSPVVCEVGDAVHAGAVSVDGEIWITAVSTADAGFLRRTIDAILRSAATKTRYQRLADRVSAWFFPLVVLIASCTLAVQTYLHGIHVGGLAAIAVIVIACPCALGLATPMALWAAVGRAAQLQVIIRDTEGFLQLAQVNRFAFDKTGTLTTGIAVVREVQFMSLDAQPLVLEVAQCLSHGSSHPLANAIDRHTQELGDRQRTSIECRTWPGRGVSAEVPAVAAPCHLGSRRWFRELGYTFPPGLPQAISDGAEVYLGWNAELKAVFRCTQTLRPEVGSAWEQLQRFGQVTVLTGDSMEHARQQLPHLQQEIHAELLPEDKARQIEAWLAQNELVAMVGDGINDGPALATATVGVALGCGMDLTRASAGICLLTSDLRKLPQMVEFSQVVNRTVRWNLIWAFVYNILGIGLAALGLINPVIAAIVMVTSSLLVVTNSLRLIDWQPTGSDEVRLHGDLAEKALKSERDEVEQKKPGHSALVTGVS